jgi:hypothetical protein
MSDHLPIKFDLFEMNLREIGHRTKRYFLQDIIMHFIDKYVAFFDDLYRHLYTNFGICIILESNYQLDDMINGIQ